MAPFSLLLPRHLQSFQAFQTGYPWSKMLLRLTSHVRRVYSFFCVRKSCWWCISIPCTTHSTTHWKNEKREKHISLLWKLSWMNWRIFLINSQLIFDNDLLSWSLVERIVSRPARPLVAKYRGSALSQHHQKSAEFSTNNPNANNLSFNRNDFIELKNAARALWTVDRK